MGILMIASVIAIGISALLRYCIYRYRLNKIEKKKQHLYRQWEMHWRKAKAQQKSSPQPMTPPLKTLSELLSNPNSRRADPMPLLVSKERILSSIESAVVDQGDANNAVESNKLRKLLISSLVNHWIFRFYNEGSFPPEVTSTSYEAILNQLSLSELIGEARHHQDDLELCEYIYYWINRS